MDQSPNTPAPHDPDATNTPLNTPPTSPGEGREPALDPDVEAQVRRLLANVPDPGSMPEAYARRITTALAEEARLRVGPGPLTHDEHRPHGGSADDRVRTPLIRQQQRRGPVFAGAAVAAAAAIVVLGGSALHLNKRAPDAAAVVSSQSSTAPGPTAGAGRSTPATDPAIHIQVSTTAYDAANLTTRARDLLAAPGPALHDLGAEAPGLGPIATPIGLGSCLAAISAPPGEVSVDLATWDGLPAAIIVTHTDAGVVAFVVERSCTTGNPGLLRGATAVPGPGTP